MDDVRLPQIDLWAVGKMEDRHEVEDAIAVRQRVVEGKKGGLRSHLRF